jgi:Tol biopolymer transport system component
VRDTSWSPDGSAVLITSTDAKSSPSVFLVSRFGGTPRRIGWGGFSCGLSGGSEVAIADQNQDTGVRLVNQITMQTKTIPAPHYQWLIGMACSSKSGKLLLLALTGEKSQIWSMKADGSEQRKLIESEKGVAFLSPRWSAANDAVYFFRQKGSTMDLVKFHSPHHHLNQRFCWVVWKPAPL